MAAKSIEEAVLEGWTVEETNSSIETAKYFRNGFLAIGIGAIAIGVTAIVGHDYQIGVTGVVMGVPMTGIGVRYESHRSSDVERLAVLDRLNTQEPPKSSTPTA